jgi:hypothetical protein
MHQVAEIKKESPNVDHFEDWVIAFVGGVFWPVILIGILAKRLK